MRTPSGKGPRRPSKVPAAKQQPAAPSMQAAQQAPPAHAEADAMLQPLVEQLLGPAACASPPPLPNAPGPAYAFALALARLSAQLRAAGGTLLVLPSTASSLAVAAAGDDATLVLDLALAETAGLGAVGPADDPARVISVGKKSTAAVMAGVVTGAAAARAFAAGGAPPGPAATLAAVGPVAVHTMLNAACIARGSLHKQALDCAFSIELSTAPWVKPTPSDASSGDAPTPAPSAPPAPADPTSASSPSTGTASALPLPSPSPDPVNDQVLLLRVHPRRLATPVVDVAEFAALQAAGQTAAEGAAAGRGARRPAAGVASATLAEVLTDLLSQRPAVRLAAINGGTELAFTLKALGLLAAGKDKGKGARAGAGGAYLAFPWSEGTGAQQPRRQQQGGGEGEAEEDAEAVFPVGLEVQRLAASPVRTAVMGPPLGRITPGSTAEGLRRTLAMQLAGSGYWSCQLDSPKLASMLLDAALHVSEALAYRGTRLGFVTELVNGKAPAPAPAGSEPGAKRRSIPVQRMVMHFLEYDPLVDDLLRPRPKAKEMALTGGQQVDMLSKVVALRNQSLASEETGQLVVRPFIDEQSVVRLAVELRWGRGAGSEDGDGGAVSPPAASADGSQPAAAASSDREGGEAHASLDAGTAVDGGGVSAGAKTRGAREADEEASLQAPQSEPKVEREGEGKVPPAPAPLKTLLVSRASDPTSVARAIGWELPERAARVGPRGVGAGVPLATLRVGQGVADVAAAAVAMVQARLAESGLCVVALPRRVVATEGGRTFAVSEWALACEAVPVVKAPKRRQQQQGGAAKATKAAKPAKSGATATGAR